MSNPVNRITGAIGLVMMGVISYQLILGQLAMVEAGKRAAVTLLAVIVVRKLGNFGMHALAGSMEREAAIPARRKSDQTDEAAVR